MGAVIPPWACTPEPDALAVDIFLTTFFLINAWFSRNYQENKSGCLIIISDIECNMHGISLTTVYAC